jgi:hypothetical protein
MLNLLAQTTMFPDHGTAMLGIGIGIGLIVWGAA